MTKSARFVVLFCFCLAGAEAQNVATAPPTSTPGPIVSAAAASPSGAADKLFLSGKFQEAETLYKAILQQDPKSAVAYVGLARTYLKQHEVELAHETARKGSGLISDSPMIHTVLGEIYFREGNFAESQKEFVRALKLNPLEGRAWLGLSRLDNALSMYGMGRKALIKAHESRPEDPEIEKRWESTLPLADRIAALERYLIDPSNDTEEQRRAMRTRLELMKERQLHPQKQCRLATKVDSTEVALEPMMHDALHLQAWGLKVNINGHNFRLLLDTGASGLLISRKAAHKAGMENLIASQYTGIGDKGPGISFLSYADSIKVGGLEFQNCMVEVSDKRSVADEDGLIGADVFEDYLVTLDFPARKFKLSPLPPRPDEKHPENVQLKTGGAEAADSGSPKPDASKPTGVSAVAAAKVPDFPKDRYIAPEMQHYSPVYRFGHGLLIATKIGESPESKLFLLDTGSLSTLISPRAAGEVTKVRRDFNTTVKGLSGTVRNVFQGDKVVLQFSHYRQEYRDVLAFDLSHISESMGTEVSGILGFSVLNMMEIKIDYRDGLVDLNYDRGRLGLAAR